MGGSRRTKKAIRAAKENGTFVDKETYKIFKVEKERKRKQDFNEQKRLTILTRRLDLDGGFRRLAGLEHMYVKSPSRRTQLILWTATNCNQRHTQASSM